MYKKYIYLKNSADAKFDNKMMVCAVADFLDVIQDRQQPLGDPTCKEMNHSGQNKQGSGQSKARARESLLVHSSMYLNISVRERLLCEVQCAITQFALALLLNNAIY
jgi:hypothetical protein